jgi:hypothetical protein
MVCADLLKKGYHIFRSVSPACPFDLIAVSTDGRMVRIECKTAVSLVNLTKHAVNLHGKKPNFDVVAYTFHSGEIVYFSPSGLLVKF